VESVEVPTPAPGEVLVRVHAASLDRGAWHFTTGIPYIARPSMGLRRPKDPGIGWDVAGVVARIGEGVTDLAVGDEVFGAGRSTFAEYAISTPKSLARKPAVSFEIAASIPVSALTALQALRDKAALRPGQRVLVVGASGGVGLYTVQIAKAFGATVTGVCSARKADVVRAAGADRVIAHDSAEATTDSERYDVVVDIGGNRSVRWLRRSLTPRGTLVIVGGEGKGKVVGISRQLRAVALSPFVRQRLVFFIANTNRPDLDLLAGMVEDGRIRPHLDRVVGLDAVGATMADMVAGGITGKAVFVP
jgi:NADPH:quinone reductase-like Zn-dependent oxidoreductase